MTAIKYALLCTILVQAMLLEAASLSKATDLDFIRTLSAPYSGAYNYQTPKYGQFFSTGLNGVPVPVSQAASLPTLNYGSAAAPVQAAPAPIQQAPAPAPAPVSYGYQQAAPVQAAPAPIQQAPAPAPVSYGYQQAPVQAAPAPIQQAPAPAPVSYGYQQAPVQAAPAPIQQAPAAS